MKIEQHPRFDHQFPERFPHWNAISEPFRSLVPDILCEFGTCEIVPQGYDLNNYNNGLRLALLAVAEHATIEETT